jgi:hypothetical protein
VRRISFTPAAILDGPTKENGFWRGQIASGAAHGEDFISLSASLVSADR